MHTSNQLNEWEAGETEDSGAKNISKDWKISVTNSVFQVGNPFKWKKI
jgi:hypothetical protein